MVLTLTHYHQGLLWQQMGVRIWTLSVLPSLSPVRPLQASPLHGLRLSSALTPRSAWPGSVVPKPVPKLFPLHLTRKRVIDFKIKLYILLLQTGPSFAGRR